MDDGSSEVADDVRFLCEHSTLTTSSPRHVGDSNSDGSLGLHFRSWSAVCWSYSVNFVFFTWRRRPAHANVLESLRAAAGVASLTAVSL
jgi:hypothetical protein